MATSLELAITAIRSGRKEEGRQLLNLLIQQNPNNEMAWLWMSSVVNNDEQRARCLYHVLAINPNNELARRGLQLLGIVVSDSRPVRIPRDSQPIPIQKPQPEVSLPDSLLSPATLPAQPPQPQPLAQPERRPFRLDPQTITQELPFVPLREPFPDSARRSPSAFVPRVEANPSTPITSAGQPSNGDSRSLPNPSEPVLAPQNNHSSTSQLGLQKPLSHPAPGEKTPVSSPPGETISLHETRPSPPVWVNQTNMAVEGSQPATDNPATLPPAPSLNSNATMGMPVQYLQTQLSPQIAPGIHSNATMSMPLPIPNGQPLPAEAMSMFHSGATMSMPAYSPALYPTPFPQGQVYHSSPTMAMPTMAEAEARARLLAGQSFIPNLDPLAALRVAAGTPEINTFRSKSAKRIAKGDEDEEEDINLVAVVVFGSLSVTALGGLGMLILLWFTSV